MKFAEDPIALSDIVKKLSAFALLVVLVVAGASADGAPLSGTAAFPPPGTRLLVVSPHPDDEILGAGGLIQRVLATGGSVKVVLVTSGDGFPAGVEMQHRITRPTADDYREYGRRRESEAWRALAAVGVTEENRVFLGFPDGGLSVLRDRYLASHGLAYTSPFTRVRQPPVNRILIPGTQYTGDDLREELVPIVRTFRPTLVVTTDARDQHPDHAATYFFVVSALRAAERQGPPLHARLLTFIIHFPHWPDAEEPMEDTRFAPPPDLPPLPWLSVSLTPAETRQKHRALLQYRSQLLIMPGFLMRFARANELFISAEATNDESPYQVHRDGGRPQEGRSPTKKAEMR